jgi:hypothetical protein
MFAELEYQFPVTLWSSARRNHCSRRARCGGARREQHAEQAPAAEVRGGRGARARRASVLQLVRSPAQIAPRRLSVTTLTSWASHTGSPTLSWRRASARISCGGALAKRGTTALRLGLSGGPEEKEDKKTRRVCVCLC